MMRTGTAIALIAGTLVVSGAANAAEPAGKGTGKKPVVNCAQIVETYKTNSSVDQTADALFVDQSVVAACLKAAGITPTEMDR